jgi:uncharacterized membrane protein YoaK (UPF0700 family)
MFSHRANSRAPLSAYASWFLLAGGAGFMNAGAFLAVGTFVTHVTGFATLFGIHAAQGQGGEALIALAVPAFFLAGAMLAGFLVVVREEKGLAPHYDWAMAVAGVCALAPVLLAHGGLPGPAAPLLPHALGQNALLLIPLCLSNGIQNAALSAASHRSVRITHLTGLTTDLGLGLARLSSFRKSGGLRRDPEFKLSAVRLGTLGSFLAGSVAGAVASQHWGLDSFVVPGAICFYAAWRGRTEKKSKLK